jgi:hypothetical protein
VMAGGDRPGTPWWLPAASGGLSDGTVGAIRVTLAVADGRTHTVPGVLVIAILVGGSGCVICR